jgi:hypothetical protein
VLGNLITDWLRDNPAKVGALSGHVGIPGGIPDQPPIFLQFNPPQLNESLPTEQGAALWGRELATYWLMRLIASPAQKRLARCAICKRYFVYQRARAQRNETRCPSCDTSQRRTTLTRSRRLETAAEAWLKSNSLSRKRRESPEEWESRRREWVTAQVNEAHGQAFGRRWVSQHLSEIQERAEALRNAKS